MTESTKISLLKKVTIGFLVFLLAVFSLNYGLCTTQNKSYMERVEILGILNELQLMVPSTSRYLRTCVDIANGYESNFNEVLEDRFAYYMNRISEDAQSFNSL